MNARQRVYSKIPMKFQMFMQCLGPIVSRWSWICLLIFVAVGCGEPSYSTVPAPMVKKPEYELWGNIRRIGGGDNFEFSDASGLHYISVRGVVSPKRGQKFYWKSINAVKALKPTTQPIRVKVVELDESMVEIADVFAADLTEEINIGLELIRRGLGWYDGNEFEGAEEYRESEALARKQKLGLWSLDNPVPPWEFEKKETRRSATRN